MQQSIILGTVQLGINYGINNQLGQPTVENAISILNSASKLGINTLDTAEAYGTAHSIISSFHQNNPLRQFRINTKFAGVQASGMESTVKNFCTKLSVNHIHTLFFHCFNDFLNHNGLLKEMQKLKEQQRIHQIGLSVYDNRQLKIAIEEPSIDVIQLPFNLLDNARRKDDLLFEAKDVGKRIQVRSVFLQGLFFKDVNSLPIFLLPLKKNLEEINNIANLSGISMEALSLAYVAAQREIDEVVIGVDCIEQLRSNIAAFSTRLNKQTLLAIDRIEVKEKNLLYPYNWK
jgi:aryl-alcohol dehydrogenase-like predicted oxidoreductase